MECWKSPVLESSVVMPQVVSYTVENFARYTGLYVSQLVGLHNPITHLCNLVSSSRLSESAYQTQPAEYNTVSW